MGKKIMLLMLIGVLLFSPGCWDKKDIEERAFVFGIAFDKPPKEVVEKQRAASSEPEHFAPRYSISYIRPLPSSVVGKGGDETYTTKSITARSPREAEREMNTRLDSELFFGHTDLILFGEDILQNEEYVKEMADYLHRSQDINWSAKVAVVEGKAKEVFYMKPKGVVEMVPYVVGIMENKKVSSRVSRVTLTQMISELGQGGTVVLPKVNLGKDEIKLEGAAILRDYKLQGYFTGQDTRSLMFLKGTIEGGGVVTLYKDILISYSIVNSQVEKELKTTEDGLKMIYKIRTEGELQEGSYGVDLIDNKLIKTMQEAIEEEIIKDANITIEKTQKLYKADVIRAGDYIQKFHPKVWKQIKDDWNDVYSSMDIQVEADVRIRRIGVVK